MRERERANLVFVVLKFCNFVGSLVWSLPSATTPTGVDIELDIEERADWI